MTVKPTTRTISRDTPLAEITLRKYERPLTLEKRELVRKLCLSTGLLQPGDSRDVIVDILYVLLQAKADKKEMSSEEIKALVVESRKAENLALQGVAPSNIRRQLKRLREVFLVEKVKNAYRINEHDTLDNIFEEKIQQYLVQNVVGRVKEYFNKVDSLF
jgi:DNA-binding transcriptional ArsR family regulator